MSAAWADVVDLPARERRRRGATAPAHPDDPLAGARCRDGTGELTRLFFSPDPPHIARAKRICATCPALVPCLEGALERREPAGVWGGQLFLDGRILATKRPRGRPRKVPRPEDHIPEIPLPRHLPGVAVVRGA
jgi:WhiB family redox-sensing transcriptional regulator